MSFFSLWFISGLVILALMILLWLLSLRLKDASIVDIFWGLGFVITYWVVTWIANTPLTARIILLGVLVTLWGLRLAIHIYQRNHGQPEDFRYAKWRVDAGQSWWWQSFFKVFLLQGVLLWIIAPPLVAVHTSIPNPLKCECTDLTGAALWLIGFMFEAGGDYQLKKFKSNPANKGKLLTTGYWSVTRHPNYFGDAAQWWGFYLIAFSAGAWWTIFSPIIMTYLLLKISGVVMLEKTLKETKPGYAEYIARTSAFFPWFPRKK
jgi:steroid 5-alpha reductase family enzyme